MTNIFYIVVTSDASTAQYHENKPFSFKMQLSSQMHLSEDWEVAITYINYPHTWQNVRSKQVSYLLRCNKGSEWNLPIYLPSGTYRTVEDLINGMVTGLESAFPDISLMGGKKMKSLGGNECSTFTQKLNITLNSTYL